MFKTIIQAIKQVIKLPKLILFEYILSLVLSFFVVQPFYTIFLTEANNSLALNKLLEGFDFMIFSDFWFQSSKAFKPLIFRAVLVVGIYMLLHLFFIGGILKTIDDNIFSPISFIKNSAKYFFKFLGLYFLSLILAMILFVLLGIIFFIFINLSAGGNERTYIFNLIFPVLLLVFCCGLLFLQSDFSKIISIRNPQLNVFQSFIYGIKYTFNGQSLLCFWVFVLIGVLVFIFYFGIDSILKLNTVGYFILFASIQQLLVWIRIILKNSSSAVNFELYGRNPLNLNLETNEIINANSNSDS